MIYDLIIVGSGPAGLGFLTPLSLESLVRLIFLCQIYFSVLRTIVLCAILYL